MSTRNIVVLANSVKHHQHCVAGKCLSTKEWIRPVSDAAGAELTSVQASCRNKYGLFGVKPKQKVIVGLSHHSPLVNQPENHVVDDSEWVQNFRIADNQLLDLLDNPSDLWGTGDRVSYESITTGFVSISQSLYLVKVSSLKLYVPKIGKRRASFSYNDKPYDLAVTDPKFDEIVREGKELEGILCISLGEAFESNCFKLVATIF